MESVVSISAPVETLTCSELISRSAKDGTSSDSDDAEMECENPFSCEICDSGNNSSAVFKERRHLDAHILKDHPTACIGCYDVFESKERLLKHLEVEKHEKPSFCHQCRGVFLDDADMENHDFGCKSSAIEEGQVSVKEECVSSDDDEEDTEVSCVNAFLCEICDSADNESHAVFKERSDLVLHTFKNHPYSCIGCFESFHSLKDLKKHAMEESHGLPFCLECCTLFPDRSHLIRHPCHPISVERDEDSDAEESEDEGEAVKMEPPSEDEGSVYASSSEEDSNDESETEYKAEIYDLNCIHCNAEDFQNQHDLRVHTCKKHPSVCVVCFEGFEDEVGLRNHQKALHHTVWKCARCDMYFIRLLLYRQHVSANHPEDCPYQCPDCDMKGFREKTIKWHRYRVHGYRSERRAFPHFPRLNWRIYQNRCSICLKTFMTSYSLLLHMFREHNRPGQTHVYKCEMCQLGFGRGIAFESHLKRVHADDTEYLSEAKTLLESTLTRPLQCEICDVLCTNTPALRSHLSKQHPESRPHKCTICDVRYPEESDVRVHMKNDHEGPEYLLCPLCNIEYKKSVYLERHLKKRHDYHPMPYVYCFAHSKGFLCYADFLDHFRIRHMDPKDRPVRPPIPRTGHPCHICGKEFGLPIRLKYHIDKVHLFKGERLKCDVCGLSFKDESSLSTHKTKHTDAYKCKICNKTFEAPAHLERHQVVHSGEKPFQCEVCGLKVSQRSSLQRHVKVVHADGKALKSLKPRRTRGPKHEGLMRKEEKTKEEEVMKTKKRATRTSDNVNKKSTLTKNRKRSIDSMIPSDPIPEETMPPKRRRGRPRKSKTEAEKRLEDDAEDVVPRRGRPRKTRGEPRRQSRSDDDYHVSDEEELLSDENGSGDER